MAITVEEALKAKKDGEETLPQPDPDASGVDRPKVTSDSLNKTLTKIQEGIGDYLGQYNKTLQGFAKQATLVVKRQNQQLASIETVLNKTKTAFKDLQDRFRKLDSRLRQIESFKPPPPPVRYRPKPKKTSLKTALIAGGVGAAALAAYWLLKDKDKDKDKKPEADASKVKPKSEIRWEGKHAILESKTNLLLDAINDIMFTAGDKIHFRADEIILDSDDITFASAGVVDPASSDTVAIKMGGQTTCNFECGAGDSRTLEDASPWEKGVNAAEGEGGTGAGNGSGLIPTMPDTIPELPGGGPAFGGPGGLDPTNPFFGVSAEPGEGTAGGGSGAGGWGPSSSRSAASDNDPSNTQTPTSTTPAGPFNAITKAPKGGTFEAGTERLYHQGGNLQGLDPKLQHVVQQASKDLPAGYRVEMISGHDARSTGTTNHPSGIAMDVIIYDDKGKPLPHDRSNHMTVKLYEKLYQSVTLRGKELYPDEKWIWGGTWISSAAGHGDPMHFQRYVKGVGSQGSGAYDAQRGAPGHEFQPYLMNDKERKDYQDQVRRNIQQEKEAVKAEAAAKATTAKANADAEKKAKDEAAKTPPDTKPDTQDTTAPKPQADASSVAKPQATDVFAIKGGGQVLSDASSDDVIAGQQYAGLTTTTRPDDAVATESPAATPPERAKGTLAPAPSAIESLLRGLFGRPKEPSLPPVKADPSSQKGAPATQGENKDQKAAKKMVDILGPEKFGKLPDDVKDHIKKALEGTGNFDGNFVVRRTAPLLSKTELTQLKQELKDEGVVINDQQTTAPVPAANPDKPPPPTQADTTQQPPSPKPGDATPVDPNKPPTQSIEPDKPPEQTKPEEPKKEEPKPAEEPKKPEPKQEAGPATADPEREHPAPQSGSYGGGKQAIDHNAGICMI